MSFIQRFWDNIDSIQKLFQTLFYLTGGVVAVLTYLSAKKGLLNTVNTEYHKKVIDNLKTLSDELWSEFDANSENYWLRSGSIKGIVDEIHKSFLSRKEEILKAKIFEDGILIGADQGRYSALTARYKSDPFLPNPIREKVVEFLHNRSKVLQEARWVTLRKYMQDLANGNNLDTLENNWGWLHNEVLQYCTERGAGLSQAELKIDEIRLLIQKYFEKYNPVKVSI
jgi:hypothetical protein